MGRVLVTLLDDHVVGEVDRDWFVVSDSTDEHRVRRELRKDRIGYERRTKARVDNETARTRESHQPRGEVQDPARVIEYRLSGDELARCSPSHANPEAGRDGEVDHRVSSGQRWEVIYQPKARVDCGGRHIS
jgi:hypothetical protein